MRLIKAQHLNLINKKKLLTMEMLFQFFDEIDDYIVATALRLQRKLSPKPRERRRHPRPSVAPNPASASRR